MNETMQASRAPGVVVTSAISHCTRIELGLGTGRTLPFDVPALNGLLSIVVRQVSSAQEPPLIACGAPLLENTVDLGETAVELASVDIKNPTDFRCRVDLGAPTFVRYAHLTLYKLRPGVHPAEYAGMNLYTADILLSHDALPQGSKEQDDPGVMSAHVSHPGLTVLTAQAERVLASRLEEGVDLEANLDEIGQLINGGALLPIWGLPSTTCRVVILPAGSQGRWSTFGCRVLKPIHYRLSEPSTTLSLHVGPMLSRSPQSSWHPVIPAPVRALSVSAYVTGMVLCTVLVQLHTNEAPETTSDTEPLTNLDPLNRYSSMCPGFSTGQDPLVSV